MRITKFGMPAAIVLCAGSLAVAAPEAALAARRPAPCQSGVYRLQVQCRHLPSSTVYAVQSVWIPFATLGTAPCGPPSPTA